MYENDWDLRELNSMADVNTSETERRKKQIWDTLFSMPLSNEERLSYYFTICDNIDKGDMPFMTVENGEIVRMGTMFTSPISSTHRVAQRARRRLWRRAIKTAGWIAYCLFFVACIFCTLYAPLVAHWIRGGK